MTVATFQNDALAVKVKAIAITNFKRAKTEALGNFVNRFAVLFQTNLNLIEMGCLGRPKFWRRDLGLKLNWFARNFFREWSADIFSVKRLNLSFNFIGCIQADEI